MCMLKRESVVTSPSPFKELTKVVQASIELENDNGVEAEPPLVGPEAEMFSAGS